MRFSNIPATPIPPAASRGTVHGSGTCNRRVAQPSPGPGAEPEPSTGRMTTHRGCPSEDHDLAPSSSSGVCRTSRVPSDLGDAIVPETGHCDGS